MRNLAEKMPKLSPAILEMMKLLSQAVYSIGLNVHPNSDDDRVPVLSYWSCAFTIHSIERVLRDEGQNNLLRLVFSQIQLFASIGSLYRSLFRRFLMWPSSEVMQSSYSSIFSSVKLTQPAQLHAWISMPLVSLFHLSCPLPRCTSRRKRMTQDAFLTPPTGNVFDRNFLNLVITLQLVQIILTTEAPVGKASADASKKSQPDEPMETE